MEIAPEIAFSAAQILSMLLVATMFDPWTKGAARGRGVPRVWVASAFVYYGAKVLALIVLLFDMQLVLFQNTWVGGQGFALGIGNYLAIVCSSLSILLAVLSHIGAIGPAENAPAGRAAAGNADADAGADRDAAEADAAEAVDPEAAPAASAPSGSTRAHRAD